MLLSMIQSLEGAGLGEVSEFASKASTFILETIRRFYYSSSILYIY